MRELVPERLWIGNAGDSRQPRTLFETGIQAVVSVAMEEPIPQLPAEMIVVRIPLYDGEGNSAVTLRLAVDTVAALVRSCTPTLLTCSAGLSRSPLVAAFALARVTGTPSRELIQRWSQRARFDLHPLLLRDLQSVFEEQDQGPAAG